MASNSGGERTDGLDRTEARSAEAPSREGYADFFARAAHDLRSPLGVILHVLRQLGTDLEPHLQDEHRTLLTLAGRGARRMQTFIDRVGLLAELESGRLRAVVQLQDVRDLAKATIDQLASTEPRSEIRVEYDPPEAAAVASADARLLRAALGELVRNAVIHAKSHVCVALEASAQGTTIHVEDDGEGLSDTAKETLYSRFVVRPARGGLGVGLSIARDLTTLQQGTLTLGDSRLAPGKPGKVGARFSLWLPGRPAKGSEKAGTT